MTRCSLTLSIGCLLSQAAGDIDHLEKKSPEYRRRTLTACAHVSQGSKYLIHLPQYPQWSSVLQAWFAWHASSPKWRKTIVGTAHWHGRPKSQYSVISTERIN